MNIVQIEPSEVKEFLAFRHKGVSSDPSAFRFIPADDDGLGEANWRVRLERDYVVAARKDGGWLGVGGFAQLPGKLLEHKGLIWGMYVAPNARGTGAADAIMKALIARASTVVRQLQLTVMADNARAISFYQRHGFEQYGVEPDAVRRSDQFADEVQMWFKISSSTST